MFALEVEYLTGRAVATQRNERTVAEWPPHPGRLYSALVAAFAECDFGPAEREALLWLEKQRSPTLSVAPAAKRDVTAVFVPINDTSVPDKIPPKGFKASQVADGVKVLPDRRSRQQRFFPSVTPEQPVVYFSWPDTPTAEVECHRDALARLATNVTYLGHSSSLVRVAICDQPPEPTLQPAEDGEQMLRVPSPGRLVQLEAAFARGSRPSPGEYRPYAKVAAKPAPAAGSVFGEMLIFRRTAGQRLPLHATLKLTIAVRNSLMALAEQPPLEVLSGHSHAGSPSQKPHAAIVPLANVDNPYADGDILGFAVILPKKLHPEERRHVLRALERREGNEWIRLEKILMGSGGAWHVERATPSVAQKSLRAFPYIEPATTWASVTPMALDRVPKKQQARDTLFVIRLACERIGLPAPIAAEFTHVSPILGVPPSDHFPPLPKDRHALQLRAHVIMHFDRPVAGPIILGAGRYLGMGLCRRYRGHGTRETPS